MRSSLFWDVMQQRLVVSYQGLQFNSLLIICGLVLKSSIFVACQFSDF